MGQPHRPDQVVQVRMEFSKATKNTFRYDAVEGMDADITSIYVKKAAFKGDRPPVFIVVAVVTG